MNLKMTSSKLSFCSGLNVVITSLMAHFTEYNFDEIIIIFFGGEGGS